MQILESKIELYLEPKPLTKTIQTIPKASFLDFVVIILLCVHFVISRFDSVTKLLY
jgi:hypothetical protein